MESRIIDVFSNSVNSQGHVNRGDDFVNTLPEVIDWGAVDIGVKEISVPATWIQPEHAGYYHWLVMHGTHIQETTFASGRIVNSQNKPLLAILAAQGNQQEKHVSYHVGYATPT